MYHWLIAFFLVLLSMLDTRAQDAESKPESEDGRIASGIHALHSAGLDNFYQLGPGIYSGAAPASDAGFASLKQRGIKTIITVDGMKPDVEMARRFGIRYVHLPIGYDGVPTNQALRLIKAVETLPGPVYVHCHHGMHRGPAAAAVICMAMENWSPAQAEGWLRLAGTSTNYAGLYKSIKQFHPPTAATLKNVPANFPERSPVSALADSMIQIDGQFDHLKLIKEAGYRTPASHPDLTPAQEALLLDELFKELLRSPSANSHSDDFRDRLKGIEAAANAFYLCLSTNIADPKHTEACFQRINEACADCHKRYRN